MWRPIYWTRVTLRWKPTERKSRAGLKVFSGSTSWRLDPFSEGSDRLLNRFRLPQKFEQNITMDIQREDTAIVFIDPQNDVLSEKGLAWPLVHESLKENNTIENMERIFKAAKAHGFEVFISPHYFYPVDKGWKFNGALETDEA